jgi:ABC-type uncharacterized transport system substrate-binding protein
MSPAGDPVGTGLVASLARPGANITGLSSYAADLGGKRLETIRAILPHLNRIAVLAHATDPFAGPFLEQMRAAAKPIGLKVVPFMVRNASELDGAFRKITGARLRAVVVQPILATREAGALGLHHHIVTMSEVRSFAEAGGLITYGASYPDIYRKAAVYVDKILKVASPADLPVEEPSKFELVINLKTAKALNLTIPPLLLQRADTVIE